MNQKIRKRIISIEDWVDVSIQGLVENINKSKGRLITADSNNIGNIRTGKKTRKQIVRKTTVWIFQAANW